MFINSYIVNLSENPTRSYIQKLNSVAKPSLKRSTIPNNLKTYALLNNDRVPVMYGMPKIHKKDIPIRPIVSSIGAPFDGITWILDRILQLLLRLIPTIVLSTKEFIHRLKDLFINWNCTDFYFISADIDSLYTLVPVHQTILSILELLSEYKLDTFGLKYEDINTLLHLSLQDNYFQLNNTFYTQGNCLAMGNRVAVREANCFVFKLERELFSTLPAKPLFWIRYIDDVIATCDRTIISENLLVTNLKNLHPNITFTYVISSLQEGVIFLDTFISTYNNNLRIGMYRKPTHSNRVLNYY